MISNSKRHSNNIIGGRQTESMGRTDRGDVGTNTEVHSEALSASSTGVPDMDEGQSQADCWSVLNDEARSALQRMEILPDDHVHARNCA